ncbi:MAG: hypothetical protein MZU97_26125 [Bacillus subtilis]|nr:hypothetical protein [Bacillus subtilis]
MLFALRYRAITILTRADRRFRCSVALWGLRLFLYIGIRNLKKPEDYPLRRHAQTMGAERIRVSKPTSNVSSDFRPAFQLRRRAADPSRVWSCARPTFRVADWALGVGTALFAIGFVVRSRRRHNSSPSVARQKKAGKTAPTRNHRPPAVGEIHAPSELLRRSRRCGGRFGLLVFPTQRSGIIAFDYRPGVHHVALLRFVSGVPLLEARSTKTIRNSKPTLRKRQHLPALVPKTLTNSAGLREASGDARKIVVPLQSTCFRRFDYKIEQVTEWRIRNRCETRLL